MELGAMQAILVIQRELGIVPAGAVKCEAL
jgi:hypothetical protein